MIMMENFGFFDCISFLKKDIRTIEDKGTVLCLQTIGVCNQSTVC